MTPQEAYKFLEVEQSISDNDLKTKYKDLAKKYHPDRYKEDPDKFKQINEAYQLITDFRTNPSKYQTSPFHRADVWDNSEFPFEINIQDIFSNFSGFSNFKPNKNANSKPRAVYPINLSAAISFKECVIGKEQKLEYQRDIKCGECQGIGSKNKGNGCSECDGFGRITQNNGNLIYTRVCQKCQGLNQKSDPCNTCKSKGFVSNQTTLTVQIPSGVQDKTILKLQGAGNYSSSGGVFGDQYTDVLLTINVEKDSDLSLEGNDVICPLNLTLLEALEGCKKSVKTIQGEETIEIKPKSRHKEEVILKNLGVKSKNGNQRVIYNVEYDKVDEILKLLKDTN